MVERQSVTSLLENEQTLAPLKRALLSSDDLIIEKLWDGPKALLVHLLQKLTQKDILVVTSSERETKLLDDLAFFGSVGKEFPSYETLPGEELSPSKDLVGKRLEILFSLQKESSSKVLFCSLPALLQKLPQKAAIELYNLSWKVGQNVKFSSLSDELQQLGYKREPLVTDKGQFALRHGILDIYPAASLDPYRIEFFGDEIEQIRRFDPNNQKSIGKEESLFITPASEELFLEEGHNCLLSDYLKKDAIILFDNLTALENKWVHFKDLKGVSSAHFATLLQFFAKIEKQKKLFLTDASIDAFAPKLSSVGKLEFEFCTQFFKAQLHHHPFIPICEFFSPFDESIATNEQELLEGLSLFHKAASLHFLTQSEGEERTLKEKLAHYSKIDTASCHFDRGYLSSGFVLEHEKFALFPYTEISRKYRVRREKMRGTYHAPPSQFHELASGDFVVHFNHGIGKFLGIKSKEDDEGKKQDFLLVEYAKGSHISVPVSQSHLISRYIGADESPPELSQLGTKNWERIKEKAEKAITSYAKELLELNAKRELAGGTTYPADSETMIAFEEEFPFTITEDQKNAIEAIKQDLCAGSGKPMDRLICGDVGYGKTEVAMRAAFKACCDGGKQVAVLVPTTILAMQHYETFRDRMANFPVRVEVVSRFCKPKEVQRVLEDLKAGLVDILVGTHRLISKDVEFARLGMVIVDEEQRFGVKAKEKLKALSAGVHCLTLSATPIPRTLYLSLVGAKTISTISTPPQDRIPISTFIANRDMQAIQNALLREFSRDGQAYFIHNRVETIYKVAEDLQQLIPDAKIVVGHGQMDAEELDKVFHSFKSGQANLLVATTIVENGVDISNANTILIDQADQFGLADLYQLRGRVGRWNRPAYAYFLIHPHKLVPALAMKRLHALKEASGHGGGMRIAMRDLELRGAGEILGTSQSGQIASVGFHLYCKMLARTVKALSERKQPNMTETQMEFFFNAQLPESYIAEASVRMEIYHRLGEALTDEEVDAIFAELKDRFGKLPLAAKWLLHLTRIKLYAASKYISHLKIDKVKITAKQGIKEFSYKTPLVLSPELFEQSIKALI